MEGSSSVLKVMVEEAFLHCAKALIRARLWDSSAQVERSCYPTYGAGRIILQEPTPAKSTPGEAEQRTHRTLLIKTRRPPAHDATPARP